MKRICPLLFSLLVVAACGPGARSIDLAETARLGSEDAPTTVVAYSDFQCPFCKRAAAELNRLVVRRPGRIKVFFKHFPLTRHDQAMNAARAAEAARLQGKFWEMHDLLFAYSSELDADVYPRLAEQCELDVERFEVDMHSQEVTNRIAADRAEGELLGVDGTPYFFIDGAPFRGSYADLADHLVGNEGGR